MKRICLAIIIDETVSVLGAGGKKKNIECSLVLTRVDRYTYECPKGHKTRSEQYEYKGFFDFINARTIEAYQK